MARFDLNEENYYIPEQDGPVLEAWTANSVIEQVARKVQMSANALRLKGLEGADPRVVAEGALIPDADLTPDSLLLEAVKYAEILPLSWEDVSDSDGAAITAYKIDWVSKFAVKYDNACLGVTAAKGTTVGTLADRPFDSVYVEATAAGNVTPTAGALTFDHINAGWSEVEANPFYAANRSVVIAHPMVRGALRNLKDSDGNPVYSSGQAVSGAVGDSLFGTQVVYSRGARTSAVQSSAPAGNPLLIFGDRSLLINGVRSGPDSVISPEVDFKTDVYNLKMRARRGFVVAQPTAFHVVEITAGP